MLRNPKPIPITYEVLLRVTDDGKDGYIPRKELRRLILLGQTDCAGIHFHISGIQELPPHENPGDICG